MRLICEFFLATVVATLPNIKNRNSKHIKMEREREREKE
jgi:hypothetical protein